MLNHGLDQPLLGTDTGYFQVIFPGPGENLNRIRVPETRLMVTPAIEAQLNERQKKMLALLAAGEKLTSRRCEQEFGITRDTASRDFALLMELGLANRQGRGRSTSYILITKTSMNQSSDNRQTKPGNRQICRPWRLAQIVRQSSGECSESSDCPTTKFQPLTIM